VRTGEGSEELGKALLDISANFLAPTHIATQTRSTGRKKRLHKDTFLECNFKNKNK